MNRKKTISTLLLLAIPFFTYFFNFERVNEMLTVFTIENLVGIIAILSGITGIVMGLASTRQASLDAVKEYFQQGDDDSYSMARGRILEAKVGETLQQIDVSKVCNFFHFWGLMNRKKYLPIWVFDGSSGLQIVKLYMKLKPNIDKKRESNRFYAVEFELLSYRIYKKYKRNFNDLSGEEWKETFNRFCSDFESNRMRY